MCLVFYLNAFDPKTGYELRTRNPPILIKAFKAALNIENNRKDSRKISRRDEVKILQNPKAHQNKQPREDDKLDKVWNVVKDLSCKVARNEKGISYKKSNYHRNERLRLHDMPYKKNWKYGRPLDSDQKHNSNKDTPDRLKRHGAKWWRILHGVFLVT